MPPEKKSEPAKPADAAPAEPAKPSAEPAAKDSAAKEVEVDLDAPASNAPPAKEGESKQSRRPPARQDAQTVFVSYNAEVAAEPKPDAEPAPAAGEPAPAAKNEPAKPEAPKDEAAKESPKDQATPPAAEPKETASAKPTEPKKEEPPVKYKPLAEVEQEIRRSLARAPAQDKVTEALNAARNELRKYFQAHASWQAKTKAKLDVPEPTPPDIKAMAEKYGLVAGETPLVDELQIGDYELGKAFRFSFEGNQFRRESFAEIAYTSRQPLYQPDQIRSFEIDVEFLYWKTKEEEPFVPALQDIRDEVVDAWKRREAYQAAKAEAEELAKKAAGDKPLKEAVGEDLAKKIVEPPEFTWLTRGSMPMGSAAPMLNVIEGVPYAGQEFMQTVFALKPSQVGVAVNTPHTAVYVVRLVAESPNEEQRRTQFVDGGLTGEMGFLARIDLQGFLNQWHRDLEKEMQVKWSRPPQAPQAVE